MFVRTIGLNRAGERHAAEVWRPDDHAMHARFREGVAAWIAAMPAKPVEYQLLDLEPDLPNDAAPYARGVRVPGLEPVEQLGDGAAPRRARRPRWAARRPTCCCPRPRRPAPAWVPTTGSSPAGARTGGGPLLANDPHLLVTQPGIWLELHLRAPGYEARGVAMPFTPGVFLGTTPHHAWGATNVTGDVQDLYEEQLSEDGAAARFGDVWEPLTVHDETDRRAGRGGAPRASTFARRGTARS